MLNNEKIIKICSDFVSEFNITIQEFGFEEKGIFNSEMLLFISLVRFFNVELIIESGRARGQSTHIIAEFFKDPQYQIYSIEFNKYSPDVKISYEKLKKYKNLHMIFGNSFEIIPELIIKECCILIDGPKDEASIKLAVKLLKNPKVKAIFIHDLHKDNPHRSSAEKIFRNYFSTDNLDFVNNFKWLDKYCWLEQAKYRESRAWAPYRRGGKKMKSYAATLLVLLNSNNPYNSEQLTIFLKEIDRYKEEWTVIDLIKGWIKDVKDFIQFPYAYIYYKKKIARKKQLEYSNFINQWFKILYLSMRASIFKLINILYIKILRFKKHFKS